MTTLQSRGKENKRLAQVLYSLEIGGSEVLAGKMAERLTRAGEYCAVYTLHPGGPLQDVLASHGVPTSSFDRRGFLDPFTLAQMTRTLRRERIQIIHTHQLGPLIYAGVAAKLLGARVVHTEHAALGLEKKRVQRLYAVAARMADVVTVVADHVGQFLSSQVGVPQEKMRLIPNGVDCEQFDGATPSDRSEWGWNSTHTVLVCIARLDAVKGHDVLFKSFSQLVALDENARLLVVGDGAERTKLELLVDELRLSERIQFTGTRADIPSILKASDIYVLPSFSEGMPIAILEAMASSKPIVATNVGAIPELVEHGSRGFVVPAKNTAELTRALEGLARDPQLRAQMGQAGRKYVENNYSFSTMMASYEETYRFALGRSAA